MQSEIYNILIITEKKSRNRVLKNNQRFFEYVTEKYSTENLSKIVYCIVNKLDSIPASACGKHKKIRDLVFLNYCDDYKIGNVDSCTECHKFYKNHALAARKKTNLEKYGTELPLQNDNIKEKQKKTNLEKYGEVTPLKNDNIKEKIKKTNIERYGFEHPIQNKDIKNKVKSTNLERYGSICSLQNEEINKKSRNTSMLKYNTLYPMQNEDIKNKIRSTNIERYGVECTLQSKLFLEQSKQTKLEKYGVEYPIKNEDIKNKIRSTNMERYGTEYFVESDKFKKDTQDTNLIKRRLRLNKFTDYKLLSDLESVNYNEKHQFMHIKCSTEFYCFVHTRKGYYIKCPKCFPENDNPTE